MLLSPQHRSHLAGVHLWVPRPPGRSSPGGVPHGGRRLSRGASQTPASSPQAATHGGDQPASQSSHLGTDRSTEKTWWKTCLGMGVDEGCPGAPA